MPTPCPCTAAQRPCREPDAMRAVPDDAGASVAWHSKQPSRLTWRRWLTDALVDDPRRRAEISCSPSPRCTFWGAWHQGSGGADLWTRVMAAPSSSDGSLTDAALRHHCYELQIGATRLGWNAWTGDHDALRAVAAHTAEVLAHGPLRPGACEDRSSHCQAAAGPSEVQLHRNWDARRKARRPISTASFRQSSSA